jgi:hypothetical protein
MQSSLPEKHVFGKSEDQIRNDRATGLGSGMQTFNVRRNYASESLHLFSGAFIALRSTKEG